MMPFTLPQVVAQAMPQKTLRADEVLSNYVYVFAVAFVVAYVFTPMMRQVATYFRIIDQPDGNRKMHKAPVAYLGGVAVFLGWITGLAISQFLRLHRDDLGLNDFVRVNFSIIVGACIIVLLGLWDDVLHLSPKVKIFGQVVAAVVLLADGVGTEITAPLLGPIALRACKILQVELGTYAWWWHWVVLSTSSATVITLVVGCCNATNLMDGLDGLCGGVTAVIAAGFLFLAVYLAMLGSGAASNWDGLRVVLALALLGAVLGFVPYNFNPASIFMGDTGSMFLGFACAIQIILMLQGPDAQPKWFLAAMVVFALPVLDTALAFMRRWMAGRPIFSPDKLHFHHQLVGRGFSVKQTVLISYGLAIGFALLGACMVLFRLPYAGCVYLVVFAYIVVAAFKMGMVHERYQPEPEPGDKAGKGMAVPVGLASELEMAKPWIDPPPEPDAEPVAAKTASTN